MVDTIIYKTDEDASLKGPVKITDLSNKAIRYLEIKSKASNATLANIGFACTILHSEGLYIEKLVIDGGGDDRSKTKWKKRVSNGLVIHSPGVTIGHLIVRNAHNGIWLAEANCTIKRFTAENCSGDFFQITADNSCIEHADLEGSLAVWPHDAPRPSEIVHRDVGQWWSRNGHRLTGLQISNLTFRQGGHRWALPPQGLMGTEATGSQNVVIKDCKLTGVHSEHGVRIENGHKCLIERVTTDGLIAFSKRKGKAGSMNTISNCQAQIADEDSSLTDTPVVMLRPAESTNDQHYRTGVTRGVRTMDWDKVDAIDGYVDSQLYGVGMSAIKAVSDVESAGSGFLDDGRPKILFEGHIFWQQLQARGVDPELYAKGAQSILHRAWSRNNYRGGSGEYQRLEQALTLCETLGLNDDAALCSISMGRYQIMGFNFERCGFADAGEMWETMQISELEQAKAFVAYMINADLFQYLKGDTPDFDGFALRYNGKFYKRNRYAEKMREAYQTFILVPEAA